VENTIILDQKPISSTNQHGMLQRIIPSSGESIPVIGIGSWKKFDVGDHAADRKNLSKILELMGEHKARLIDSSPMYGRSEQVIGDLTNETGLSDKFFYATKVWTNGREAGIEQMKDSLRKMKRKVMDLIQIHNLVDWQTHLKTLRQWKAEGRVRYIGITHYTTSSHPDLERIIERETLDFIQVNYSIATRNAEKKLLPLAMDRGVAVIINEPLEKGTLFDKTRKMELPSWATDQGIQTWADFFLKYIISHPAITCVIPATSNPSHMEDNLIAGEGYLPGEEDRKNMLEYFERL
jgi:diketogulonate reductase-like aldo/keto reductase